MSPYFKLPEASVAPWAALHQVLPRAFGHDHNGVPPPRQPILETREEPVLALELKRNFRNKHIVHAILGQRREGRDETRITAHQLHEADAVGITLRLAMRAADGAHRLGKRGLEAEALVHELEIVVDRLGDADDTDLEVALGHFLHDRLRAAQGAITADDKEDIDAVLDEEVDDVRRLSAARASCRGQLPPSWFRSLTKSGVRCMGRWLYFETNPS